MGEFDEGKEKFLQGVKSIDSAVEACITVVPTRGIFLVSFTKAGQRKFLTISEDDILDLTGDPDILKKVTGEVQGSITTF